MRFPKTITDRPKNFSIRQIERIDQIDELPPGSQNIVKYFWVSLMRCKWQIENSTWRIVQKILYSPNKTNRSNRQASTRVPEYREIFLSGANEMQMADRKLYQADRPKNFSIRQIERIDQIDKLPHGSQNIVKYF